MADNTNQALAFVEALESDSRLQAQFAVASPNNLDGVVDFASGKGYIFSQHELEMALKQFPQSSIVEQLRQYVR